MRTTVRTLTATLLTIAFTLGAQAAEYKPSGFIKDMPELAPDGFTPGALRWEKPGGKVGTYTKILLEPIEIWLDPDSEYKGISPDQMKLISDRLREIIVTAMEPEFPVISQPGPGVLRVRLALVHVKLSKQDWGIFGYTPIGLAVQGVTALSDQMANINLKGAAMEAEAVDSKTGERVGIRIAPQFGKDIRGTSEHPDWTYMDAAMKAYAERFHHVLKTRRFD